MSNLKKKLFNKNFKLPSSTNKTFIRDKTPKKQYFHFYKASIRNLISNFKTLLLFSEQLRNNNTSNQKIDWLTISSVLILGYLLLRSGGLLVIYLIIWNIYPPAQYTLQFNPISYEVYLIILSFFLAWYSLRILNKFPKEFQINLWLFQQLKIEQLPLLANYYLGFKISFFEKVISLLLLYLFYLFPHAGIYGFWILTLTIEIYCFLTIRKPQVLLFNPRWIKAMYDLTESAQKEGNSTISAEETLQIPLHESFFFEQTEAEEVLSNDEMYTYIDQMPYPYDHGISQEEFETFFGEQTFIAPETLDTYDDEFFDGWVNWFWLNLGYKALPLLCFLNIILFVLLIFFGVPHEWIQNMHITYSNMSHFIYGYQDRMFFILNNNWTSSWKWAMGGLYFRSYMSYFTKFYNDASTSDIYGLFYQQNQKKYRKYTYYLNSSYLRIARLFNEILPGYYWYQQLKGFFYQFRAYGIPLRNTYLYSYLLYDDLKTYQSIKNNIKNRFFSDQVNFLLTNWFIKRSKTWLQDYYYVAPEINIFPEKYYFWLRIVRLLFVMDQLNLSILDSRFVWRNWFLEERLLPDPELGKFALKEFLVSDEDMEKSFTHVSEQDQLQHRFNLYSGTSSFFKRAIILYNIFADELNYSYIAAGSFADKEPGHLEYKHGTDFRETNRLILESPQRATSNFDFDTPQQPFPITAYYPYEQFVPSRAMVTNREPRFSPYSELEFPSDDGIIDEGLIYELIRNALQNATHVYETGAIDYYTLYRNGKMRGKLKKKLQAIRKFFYYYLKYFASFIDPTIIVKEENNSTNYLAILQDLSQVSEYIDEEPEFFLKRYGRELSKIGSDYDDLNNIYNNSNLDILPLLQEDIMQEDLNTTLLSGYVFRDDLNKVPLKKRQFLDQELLQLFGYVKSWRETRGRRTAYQNAGIYDTKLLSNAMTNTEDETFLSFLDEIIMYWAQPEKYKYFKGEIEPLIPIIPSENTYHYNWNYLFYETYLDLYQSDYSSADYFDNLFSENFSKYPLSLNYYYKRPFNYYDNTNIQLRNELKNLQNLIWYRYYYNIDSKLDNYDIMPSYRDFYMKIWPKEYLSDRLFLHKHNINTIDYLSIGKGKIENGFLIYEDFTDIPLSNFFFSAELLNTTNYIYLF